MSDPGGGALGKVAKIKGWSLHLWSCHSYLGNPGSATDLFVELHTRNSSPEQLNCPVSLFRLLALMNTFYGLKFAEVFA